MQTEEKNQEEKEIKKEELKKNNTIFAATIYLLCILVMVGATCFMYKDKIKMKYMEHKITKSVKKTYDIDKIYDVSIVKLDDVAYEFRNYEDFDYNKNGEYYKMFFSLQEGAGTFVVVADKKGKIYEDTYVNKKYEKEVMEYMEGLLGEVSSLKDVEYRLTFTPWRIFVAAGTDGSFEEFKTNYEDNRSYTLGLTELIISGQVSDDMINDICATLKNAGCPFSVKMFSMLEKDFDEIKNVEITEADDYMAVYNKLHMTRCREEWSYSRHFQDGRKKD